jgi:hypothetical protein
MHIGVKYVYPVLLILIMLSTGCGKDSAADKPAPILIDEFSLYITDPGEWNITGPEQRTMQGFLLMENNGIESSFAQVPNLYMEDTGIENMIANFSRETHEDYMWLPGCHRYLLDSREIRIDEQWYFVNTLLINRDPVITQHLTALQKAVHRREIEIYPDSTDMILRMYYGLRDQDIYIISFSGLPEDFAAMEPEIIRLISNIKFSGQDALSEMGELPSGD